VVAIWVPIKDLATFDAFLGEVEDVATGRAVLAAEVRLRPLSDPMRLNGCAMVVVNPPPGLAASAAPVVDWLAANLGEAGAVGRITDLAAAD
jgi:23S rRNA (adenine2030-N6)-methyltransferase